MKNQLTKRQMINNELAVRAQNKISAKKLEHHVPKEEQEGLKIAFSCECADPTCKKHISLTLNEYAKLHKNFACFVIVKGHNEPKVEKVRASNDKISLVDKYSLL
jgi:hypothetical protein